MDELSKLARMLEILRGSPEHREKLFSDPEGLL